MIPPDEQSMPDEMIRREKNYYSHNKNMFITALQEPANHRLKLTDS
jgi:hypothetical protein